jgi:hypothetical protein
VDPASAGPWELHICRSKLRRKETPNVKDETKQAVRKLASSSRRFKLTGGFQRQTQVVVVLEVRSGRPAYRPESQPGLPFAPIVWETSQRLGTTATVHWESDDLTHDFNNRCVNGTHFVPEEKDSSRACFDLL